MPGKAVVVLVGSTPKAEPRLLSGAQPVWTGELVRTLQQEESLRDRDDGADHDSDEVRLVRRLVGRSSPHCNYTGPNGRYEVGKLAATPARRTVLNGVLAALWDPDCFKARKVEPASLGMSSEDTTVVNVYCLGGCGSSQGRRCKAQWHREQ